MSEINHKVNEMWGDLETLDLRIGKDLRGRLCGSWHFTYKGLSYGQILVGIQGVARLIEDAAESYAKLKGTV